MNVYQMFILTVPQGPNPCPVPMGLRVRQSEPTQILLKSRGALHTSLSNHPLDSVDYDVCTGILNRTILRMAVRYVINDYLVDCAIRYG